MISRIVPTLIVAVACASPLSAQVAPGQVAQAQESGFIEVSGTGSVEVEADRAQVAFAVETTFAAAADAAAANADLMDGVLSVLRASGLPELRIETFGYSLRPEYTFPDADRIRARVISAYVATNNVRVTIGDVEAVGRVIDMAIGAGANRVSSIGFSSSRADEARTEALAWAVDNALQQAQAIAAALGRALGEPLEVRGGSQRPVGPRLFEIQAQAAFRQAAPTPIEAGDQVVRANVTIRFALGAELPGR